MEEDKLRIQEQKVSKQIRQSVVTKPAERQKAMTFRVQEPMKHKTVVNDKNIGQ
jgi:hypothetical protein